MNGWKIVLTNPYTGHYSCIKYVWGHPFLYFCSQDKSECEQWLEENKDRTDLN